MSADALAIAIVGSRRPSAYGLHVAEHLAFDLAARGVTIISGLARGIDTAAHRGALAAEGRTIAVLGCGIDVVYPPENARLMRQIEGQGAILSQFAPGTPPLAYNFPTRNRTLAGLALGVVVVEAGERSGALVTAGYAGDLGREVFAIPGRITAEESRGTNALLRDGAILVRNWADVVQELPDMWRCAVRAPQRVGNESGPPGIESEEGRVLALLRPDEPIHIEALITGAELPPARAAAALVCLELGGWARQLEGQRWVAATVHGQGRSPSGDR
ncbi:MAG: DNA protecting protein DprA [Candidatus Rokubacteria bacterium 13_1_40CM_68_15]|nr:MAG: DNA protecting protein DprA [Candidatus Rokubacteria bacterium 13_1_40CM_68_15]